MKIPSFIKFIAAGAALVLAATFTLTSCAKVLDSGDSYTPISYSPVSSENATSSAAAVSSVDLGTYLVQPNDTAGNQSLYITDKNGQTKMLTNFAKGDRYIAGPLSDDGTKLFLYKQDANNTAINAEYYGAIINLSDPGLISLSPQPMFLPGTVCWSGNDKLFVANRTISFYSAADFSLIATKFDIMNTIQNDPQGRYTLTGMMFDSKDNLYIALVGQRAGTSSQLSDQLHTKQGFAVITPDGKTTSLFFPSTTMYCPAGAVDGSLTNQTPQVTTDGKVVLYTAYFDAKSNTPNSQIWKISVVNFSSQKEITLSTPLETAVVCGNNLYGVALTPFTPWWTTTNVYLFKPSGAGKYTLSATPFTESGKDRFADLTSIGDNNTYAVYAYPDGGVLMKSYATTTNNTRIILHCIAPSGTVTTVGALPGNDRYMYSIVGIDPNGGILSLSDYPSGSDD